MTDFIAQIIQPAGAWQHSTATCVMTYDARFMRRKVVITTDGRSVLVDLAQVTSLAHGDAFETTDGAFIDVKAAPEPLLAITSADLTRVAWHIGNRHTPCQIEPDRLLIQHDHVMADMLAKIGADVFKVVEPFTPEGGAYGHGRTHGHDHSHQHGPTDDHDHSHAHEH